MHFMPQIILIGVIFWKSVPNMWLFSIEEDSSDRLNNPTIFRLREPPVARQLNAHSHTRSLAFSLSCLFSILKYHDCSFPPLLRHNSSERSLPRAFVCLTRDRRIVVKILSPRTENEAMKYCWWWRSFCNFKKDRFGWRKYEESFQHYHHAVAFPIQSWSKFEPNWSIEWAKQNVFVIRMKISIISSHALPDSKTKTGNNDIVQKKIAQHLIIK